MHPQAFEFVEAHADPSPGLRVLDIGGQDMNGTVKSLFPGANYLTIDAVDGPGVDVVTDAATWRPPILVGTAEVVVCCEVFEHAPAWRDIVKTAYELLRPGGRFIATMAGPGRPEHSGRRPTLDLDPDEHYENIAPEDLWNACRVAGFVDVHIDVAGGSTSPDRLTEDVRVTAHRPLGVWVVSGIFGGYDTELLGHVPQNRAVGQRDLTPGMLMLTDHASAFDGDVDETRIYPHLIDVSPMDAFDPRQAARWPKFAPADIFGGEIAEGDVVIWVDGRVEITDPDFVPMVMQSLGDADYAAWRHPTCRTMAEQATLCLNDMPTKYTRADLIAHHAYNAARCPDGYETIWQLTIMAIRNNAVTRAAGTDILAAMAAYPRSIDQAAFPYETRRHGARVASLPGGMPGFWEHHGRSFRLRPHKDGT